ncbi:AAA family ATPase [Kitasatospora sp. NPDC006697]|uniref:AAA family ATPase n=1 Tax=Kitasatospora sp. NPDC006697 TaxID=3364020 RepID=UPI0036B08ECC
MRRFIFTGTPGAGKTTLLHALAARGHNVVPEAATDVIARAQAAGVDEPWAEPEFIERIATEQRERQLGAVPAALQLFDRSPVCTYALAEYLGLPVPAALRAELERIATQRVYQPAVFFVRNLGFCVPTAARRISFADSLDFERVHRQSYRSFGFALLEIPAVPLADRVALVESALAAE